MAPKQTTQPGSISALFRDERFLKFSGQAIFIIVVLLGFFALANNVNSALLDRGITPNFAFLTSRAGFGIFGAEAYYSPDNSYMRAFFVGLENTLRVISVGLVLALVLGILFGIFLLSTNFLVRTLARFYVEILRNTPLLVQIFAWFYIFVAAFPNIRDSIEFPAQSPLIAINNRGVYIADFIFAPRTMIWMFFMAVTIIALVMTLNYLTKRRIETGQGYPGLAIGVGFLLAGALVGWLIATIVIPLPETVELIRDGETTTVTLQEAYDQELLLPRERAELGQEPLVIVPPQRQGLRYAAGTDYNGPYVALLLALSIYTSAFIAEIVRAGIQAIDKGQVEAARALGLTRAKTLRLIVLPQALRVIIPPLGNQFLNLSKNSSLAIAIAYSDVFQVSYTIINQSGQTVTIFILIMGTYLTISLLISAFMNWVNRRFQLVTR